MALSLNWPGELSHWISLSEATRDYAPDNPEAKAEAEKAAAMLAGVEIRIRTIERRRFIELIAIADNSRKSEGLDRVMQSEIADYEIAKEGLAAIRGIAGGDPPDIDSRLLDALAATNLIPVISQTIIKYNTLSPEDKRAFFISGEGG